MSYGVCLALARDMNMHLPNIHKIIIKKSYGYKKMTDWMRMHRHSMDDMYITSEKYYFNQNDKVIGSKLSSEFLEDGEIEIVSQDMDNTLRDDFVMVDALKDK